MTSQHREEDKIDTQWENLKFYCTVCEEEESVEGYCTNTDCIVHVLQRALDMAKEFKR